MNLDHQSPDAKFIRQQVDGYVEAIKRGSMNLFAVENLLEGDVDILAPEHRKRAYHYGLGYFHGRMFEP